MERLLQFYRESLVQPHVRKKSLKEKEKDPGKVVQLFYRMFIDIVFRSLQSSTMSNRLIDDDNLFTGPKKPVILNDGCMVVTVEGSTTTNVDDFFSHKVVTSSITPTSLHCSPLSLFYASNFSLHLAFGSAVKVSFMHPSTASSNVFHYNAPQRSPAHHLD